jgi:hypothetical protein
LPGIIRPVWIALLAAACIVVCTGLWAGSVAAAWAVGLVLASGFVLLAWMLRIDRRTRASIEANVTDAVRRRDRVLGRR